MESFLCGDFRAKIVISSQPKYISVFHNFCRKREGDGRIDYGGFILPENVAAKRFDLVAGPQEISL